MRNADHEAPWFLHIYKYIGTFATTHKTAQVSETVSFFRWIKQIYLKKETVSKTVWCVLWQMKKDLISTCDRIDIKPSPKMYMIQLRSSSLCRFFHSPLTSSLLDLNTFFSILFLNTLSVCCSLNVRDLVSHPYKTKGKIIFQTNKMNVLLLDEEHDTLSVDEWYCTDYVVSYEEVIKWTDRTI